MANNYGKKINSYKTAYFHKQTPARSQVFCRPSWTPSQRTTGPIPCWCQAGEKNPGAAGAGLTDPSQGFGPRLLVPPCPTNLNTASNCTPTAALTGKFIYLLSKENLGL